MSADVDHNEKNVAARSQIDSDNEDGARVSRRRPTSKRRRLEDDEDDEDIEMVSEKNKPSAEIKTPRKRSGYASADEALPDEEAQKAADTTELKHAKAVKPAPTISSKQA